MSENCLETYLKLVKLLVSLRDNILEGIIGLTRRSQHNEYNRRDDHTAKYQNKVFCPHCRQFLLDFAYFAWIVSTCKLPTFRGLHSERLIVRRSILFSNCKLFSKFEMLIFFFFIYILSKFQFAILLFTMICYKFC